MNDAINKLPGQIGSAAFEPDHPDGPRICIMSARGVVIAYPGNYIYNNGDELMVTTTLTDRTPKFLRRND